MIIDNLPTDRDCPGLVNALEKMGRRTVTSHGNRRVVWHSWGSGPALVALHGGSGSWRHWVRNIGVLASRYQVITPDLPGMGESDVVDDHNRPQQMAEVLREGLKAILDNSSSFDLIGFSFGGLIAGHLALQEPENVRSLTIIGTTGWRELQTNKIDLVSIRHLSPAQQREAHRENLRRIMIADPSRIDDDAIWIQSWHAEHTRIDSRAFYANGPLTDVIPRLRMQVNGIWGELDAIARPHVHERERLLRALSGTLEFRQIDGAGHWAAYERPNEFNEALLELLSRTYP